MTYFRDLSPCSYGGHVLQAFEPDKAHGVFTAGHWTPTLPLPLAVGWLSRSHPFTKGTVSPEFRRRLDIVLEERYELGSSRGWHECEFCDASTAGPVDASNKPSLSLGPCGYGTLSIPGRSAIYFAPDLIAHYIDEHEYRPPQDFVTAVLECPPFRSAEYFLALLEIVGPPFAMALERAIGEQWPGFEWVADCGRAAPQRYRGPGARLRRWVNGLLPDRVSRAAT